MPDHDHSYKLLFTHPEMVADLLRGFVKEPWVAELDFDTLEEASGNYVSLDLREREDDTVWRVRWRDRWLYVYILLEFQSTVDPFMAVRVLTYLGLLYQDLIAQKQFTKRGLLPPVLPIVLYNGLERWTASCEVGDLIETPPGGLERYRPGLTYLLLEENRYTEEELAPLQNLVAALFRLEVSRGVDDLRRIIEALIEWMKAPEQMSLRRAFTVWLQRVILPDRLPGVTVPEMQDLQEVRSMLAERVEEWTREWREEGRREGRQEGRQDTLVEVLTELLESKFGPLAEERRRQVAAANAGTLSVWVGRVLAADRVEDVLGEAGSD